MAGWRINKLIGIPLELINTRNKGLLVSEYVMYLIIQTSHLMVWQS